MNIDLEEIFTSHGLSKREALIAKLVSDGMSNQEVGSKLGISHKTVKFHLTNIYKNLKIRGRTQLLVWAIKKNEDFI